jgi:hypothetical protein
MGGKIELNVAKPKPLQEQRVMLFPDTDETGQTYRDWYEIACYPLLENMLFTARKDAVYCSKGCCLLLERMLFTARKHATCHKQI